MDCGVVAEVPSPGKLLNPKPQIPKLQSLCPEPYTQKIERRIIHDRLLHGSGRDRTTINNVTTTMTIMFLLTSQHRELRSSLRLQILIFNIDLFATLALITNTMAALQPPTPPSTCRSIPYDPMILKHVAVSFPTLPSSSTTRIGSPPSHLHQQSHSCDPHTFVNNNIIPIACHLS